MTTAGSSLLDVRHPKGKGAWYLTCIRECPICGRDDETRIRMHTPRPENIDERYDYAQEWDGCHV